MHEYYLIKPKKCSIILFQLLSRKMEIESIQNPKIILVDDHIIFRQGLKSLINYEKLVVVVS